MKAFSGVVLATAAAISGQTVIAAPSIPNTASLGTIIEPGNLEDMSITNLNTVNSSLTQSPITTLMATDSNTLHVRIHHNFPNNGEQLYAYITGRDANDVPVILTNDNAFHYPNPLGRVPEKITADIARPLTARGEYMDITVPHTIKSGRIYVSEGELTFAAVVSDLGQVSLVEPAFTDPADPNANKFWGFVELTNDESGITANISFVDFIGMVFSMRLTLTSGAAQEVVGLQSGAIGGICRGLKEQSRRDGWPWARHCMYRADGTTALRVLAPNIYYHALTTAGGAAANSTAGYINTKGGLHAYYDTYIDQVWDRYTREDLVIATQGEWGNVSCRVDPSSRKLFCAGDPVGFSKPATRDILGCNSGPFQNTGDRLHRNIVARLCAAFHRSELLLPGGNVTPSLGAENYYTADPTVHYSRLIHEHEVGSRGYAFSYDDVDVNGQNAAGVVAGPGPRMLEVWAGGR